MGELRFTVPNLSEIDAHIWESAYITGIEGIPWHCQHRIEGNQFSIGREIDESGKLNIVWPTAPMGNLCLSTTSLRVREEPYNLPVEIARGTVYRLKSQAFEWERIGLRATEEFFPLAEGSLTKLLSALVAKRDSLEQLQLAQEAIDLAVQASEELCEAFSRQALDARKNNEGRLSTLLGAQLTSEDSVKAVGRGLATAFNFCCISADFGTVEAASGKKSYSCFDEQMDWAAQADQKTCIGPMVDFRDGHLPEWMFLLGEGFDSVYQAACAHVESTVQRYRGKAHLWNCATGINVPNRMGWTDEEVLRMAVSLIETVRRSDDRSPVLLTIDQPWSEYLRDDTNGISPLHFADALIRADLGLSGLALELNLDIWPGGSFPRDLLEVNRLIDRWSMLGLPLMVILSAPSSVDQDLPNHVSSWLPAQARMVPPPDALVRLLVSKPSVHAVIWDCLADKSDKSLNGNGLWDASGKAKQILGSLAQLRQSYLH